MDQLDVGDLIGVGLTLAFFGYLFWGLANRRRRFSDVVPDEPPGTPYRVYSKDFDLTIAARDLPRKLVEESLDRLKGWTADPETWHRRVALAETSYGMIDPDGGLAAALRQSMAKPSDWAIALLVDQSGSMKGEPIHGVAAGVRWFAEVARQQQIPVAILGFSTVGWLGGKAKQAWLSKGAPKRPGRLCALLHVVYQDFGEVMTEDDWRTMLHPDILRENVDGEAIEWAIELLEGRQEPNRLLIVVSDGAPVDDTTLKHNGLSYLVRHATATIKAAEARNDIMIAAVGVFFAVNQYYEQSEQATPSTLPEALVRLVGRMSTMRKVSE